MDKLATALAEMLCVDTGACDLLKRSQISTVPSCLPIKNTPGRVGLHLATVNVVTLAPDETSGPIYQESFNKHFNSNLP
jgi:hypothetical protein